MWYIFTPIIFTPKLENLRESSFTQTDKSFDYGKYMWHIFTSIIFIQKLEILRESFFPSTRFMEEVTALRPSNHLFAALQKLFFQRSNTHLYTTKLQRFIVQPCNAPSNFRSTMRRKVFFSSKTMKYYQLILAKLTRFMSLDVGELVLLR